MAWMLLCECARVCVLKCKRKKENEREKRERQTEWKSLKSEEVNSEVSKLTRGILDAAITSVTNDLNETTSKFTLYFYLYHVKCKTYLFLSNITHKFGKLRTKRKITFAKIYDLHLLFNIFTFIYARISVRFQAALFYFFNASLRVTNWK